MLTPNTERSLLSILRSDANAPAPTDLRAWEHLLVRARDAGLSGLLRERLLGAGHVVPAEVLNKLDMETAHTAAANRCILGNLERIATAAADAGIDVLALKGGALLLSLYDDPGLRPMCDIDLLIRGESAEAFDRLLVGMGYDRGVNLLRSDFYPRYHYEREYLGGGPRPVRLDVHVRPWRPLRYGRIVPDDALWDECETRPLGNASVRMPSATYMAMHLVCHAAFHGAERLLWLADVHRFVTSKRDAIDWVLLEERLRAWNLTHAAWFGLARTEEAFGPSIPDEFRDALASIRPAWRDRLALWQAPRDAASPVTHTIGDLLCTHGWRYRAGYLAAVLLPDSAHLAEVYAGRHAGWKVCAHIVRACRKIGSVVTREPGAQSAFE